MGELARISHTHDQIIDWMLANPNQPQSLCAATFGYTQSWLSTLIHSDLFQAKLQERQETIFGEVALSVKDRITSLAHDSLAKLQEKIYSMDNPEHLIATSELALKALGFVGTSGAGRPPIQVNNFNGPTQMVTKDVLAEARARLEGRGGQPLLAPSTIPLAIANAERIVE